VSGTDPSPRNLLVVRLGAMGDVIHTIPAAAKLRRVFPDTQIGWVVEERWAELLCAKDADRSGPASPSRPLVDLVHVVNTKAWRKSPLSDETRRQFSAALKEIRNQKYEVAIDFQGAIKSALLARLSGAETVYGMQEPREAPARMFYARRVKTSGAHVIEQYQSLAKAIVMRSSANNCRDPLDETGVDPRPHAGRTASSVPFPRDEAAEAAISEQLRNVGGDIVILSPGAGWATKEWPP